MSKVAEYLQGHIVGDLSARKDIREGFSTDSSILSVMPEIAIYPKNANDVRKITRFSWQLAEKGHVLPVTVRGFGADTTGASLGTGIIVSMTTYMNSVFEYDPKQQLIRVGAGASVSAVQDALHLADARLDTIDREHATIGGVIANDSGGMYSGKYGTIRESISQLEVVLASGEVLQTERLSRREFQKRKGMTGSEGDIYRGIEAILEDHQELIDALREADLPDTSGYHNIIHVQDRDGSFDLTPLFAGSQGTLGIITEVIFKANAEPTTQNYYLFSVATLAEAEELLDELRDTQPSALEFYDMHYVRQAREYGRNVEWCSEFMDIDNDEIIVLCCYEDIRSGVQKKSAKKARKLLDRNEYSYVTETDCTLEQIVSIRDMPRHIVPAEARVELYSPQLFPGFYLPHESFDECVTRLDALSAKLNIPLPLYGSALQGIYSIRVAMSARTTVDRQKLFKLIDAVATIVYDLGGTMTASNGEGRLYSGIVADRYEDELRDMYEEIRDVFDSHRILNPDIKTATDLKDLVKLLRTSSTSRHPEFPDTL